MAMFLILIQLFYACVYLGVHPFIGLKSAQLNIKKSLQLPYIESKALNFI